MSFKEPPARVLVHGQGVVLVDDVASIGHAILVPSPTALDGRIEEVHVRIQRELRCSRDVGQSTAGARAQLRAKATLPVKCFPQR